MAVVSSRRARAARLWPLASGRVARASPLDDLKPQPLVHDLLAASIDTHHDEVDQIDDGDHIQEISSPYVLRRAAPPVHQANDREPQSALAQAGSPPTASRKTAYRIAAGIATMVTLSKRSGTL